MTVKEMIEQTGWNVIANEEDLTIEIDGAFVGDLLSWVMGNSSPQQAWITVQAHLNVIAVAVLREFSCLIICQGAEVEKEVLDKALEEHLPVIQTKLSAYEVCKQLIALGI